MIHKDDIADEGSLVSFFIPQAEREIQFRLTRLTTVIESLYAGKKALFKKKPAVYELQKEFVEIIGGGVQTAKFFSKREDVELFRNYVWYFFWDNIHYGYVRMNRTETESYLSSRAYQKLETPFHQESPWRTLKMQDGKVVLINSSIDEKGHGTLFESYQDFEMESKSLEEFMRNV
ncbi:hypothetical protein [Hymenobacter terrenus]|uniref:hypothetical protein n=1 Tax=Hymenobacter terrenus TaxID=1629124 RepID=UPI00061975B9|nr:hypothetical protein [Hymenobacter terrenus]